MSTKAVEHMLVLQLLMQQVEKVVMLQYQQQSLKPASILSSGFIKVYLLYFHTPKEAHLVYFPFRFNRFFFTRITQGLSLVITQNEVFQLWTLLQ